MWVNGINTIVDVTYLPNYARTWNNGIECKLAVKFKVLYQTVFK